MELGKDIKCLIFDFDGTIFHLDIDWDKVKQDLKLDKQTSPGIGQHIQQLNRTKHADLGIVTQSELSAVDNKKLDEHVQRTLESLGSEGIKLAILTRNSRLAVERLLANSRMGTNIFIVGREDVNLLKPDPEGLRGILNHFGLDSGQAILIGDTSHDVEAARSCGIDSIIVKNPKLSYVPKGADYYIGTISELKKVLRND